jgi:methionyl-tRNA synthetase
MQQKYFAGVVQALSAEWPAEDCALRDKFAQAEGELKGFMAELQFHRALEALWSALDHANRYIVQTAPFTMVKDPNQQARVGEVLHHLLEVIRTLSRLLAPFMPDTASELRALLALPDNETALHAPWGQGLQPGHKVNGPKVLFPRIETDAKN